jgi:hypothetical protein
LTGSPRGEDDLVRSRTNSKTDDALQLICEAKTW